MEFCIVSTEAGRSARPGTVAMLTRADFDAAVKDALRHYTRADLLVRSPLLESRIATARGAKQASVTRLQQALAEAAETIFVNERDQKRRRVLDLTYFQSAAKQEAVAERWGFRSAPIAAT